MKNIIVQMTWRCMCSKIKQDSWSLMDRHANLPYFICVAVLTDNIFVYLFATDSAGNNQRFCVVFPNQKLLPWKRQPNCVATITMILFSLFFFFFFFYFIPFCNFYFIVPYIHTHTHIGDWSGFLGNRDGHIYYSVILNAFV